ncbi:hypothetical protein GUITHDRAFT_122559, partial [Guillardia theta CCMP2712]
APAAPVAKAVTSPASSQPAQPAMEQPAAAAKEAPAAADEQVPELKPKPERTLDQIKEQLRSKSPYSQRKSPWDT